MHNTIHAEAEAGFPRMLGTQLRGTVPVTEALVNQLTAQWPITVKIREDNRISVRAFIFQLSATIIQFDPDLRMWVKLDFLSWAAWKGLRSFKPKLNAYVREDGNLICVEFGLIPQVARYRMFWRHLTLVRTRTAGGTLFFELEANVRPNE